MKCFHVTTTENAAAIITSGFRDNPKTKDRSMAGVWISSSPLSGDFTNSSGDHGDTVLVLNIPKEIFAKYKKPNTRGGRVRVAIIPAKVLNRFGAKAHDHDWQGCNRKQIENAIDGCVSIGKTAEAKRIRNCILPFLEQHGMLQR